MKAEIARLKHQLTHERRLCNAYLRRLHEAEMHAKRAEAAVHELEDVLKNVERRVEVVFRRWDRVELGLLRSDVLAAVRHRHIRAPEPEEHVELMRCQEVNSMGAQCLRDSGHTGRHDYPRGTGAVWEPLPGETP
jgi:hypothetical protein